jgi:hypothetical protein
MLVSELTMIWVHEKKNIQKRNKKAHWHKMSGVNYIARRPIYAFLNDKTQDGSRYIFRDFILGKRDAQHFALMLFISLSPRSE